MSDERPAEEVDVVVVGAGLSGIGMACRLVADRPSRRVVVLEAREGTGGTWDLFRYPGVRSDSDMFTFGYPFRPWRGPKAIAQGEEILAYLRETAAAYGVDRLVRTRHRVDEAAWSSADSRWRLTVARPEGELVIRCRFLVMCTGFYDYDQGYQPVFAGQDDFTGTLVHPQHWPDGLELAGRRVVVIGSGATAVTLVPTLVERGADVVMVQRSPSYVASLPTVDPLARRLDGSLPPRVLTLLLRVRSIGLGSGLWLLSRHRPASLRAALIGKARSRLPAGYDVDTHFSPRYDPWDQRLCVTPDDELFAAIRTGRVEVVTDTVAGLTPDGVRLASGREVAADVVVTATGLELLALGGVRLRVDGREITPARTLAYKGLMLTGVPNLAFTIGYVNASWTLRADLVARYVVRLLRRLDRRRLLSATPEAPPSDERAPLIPFTSTYVRRGGDRLPPQGTRWPWRLVQSYPVELVLLRLGPVTNRMRFTRAGARRHPHLDEKRKPHADVRVR